MDIKKAKKMKIKLDLYMFLFVMYNVKRMFKNEQ